MDIIPVICDRCRATGPAGEPRFTDLAGLLDFAPVPCRPRVNGWTPALQRAFIAALAVTGSPRRAAHALGKFEYGAAQLRKAPGAAAFNAAWDKALAIAEAKGAQRLAAGLASVARADAAAAPYLLPAPAPDHAQLPEPLTAPRPEDRDRLEALSLHRAIHGVEQPVFHGGRQVGARRVFNEQLAMFHLRRAAEAAGSGGGGPRTASARAITDPHEVRLHTLMRENPLWNRTFAEAVIRSPQGLVRKHPRPWRFGHVSTILEHLALCRQALRQELADEPAKAAAYEILFGPEADPENMAEALAAVAALLHCLFPGLADNIERVARV
jgi:hypothetical protein